MWITLLMIGYIQSGNKNTVECSKRGKFFSYTRYGFHNLHSIPLLGISSESRGTLIKTLAWNPRLSQSPSFLISSSGSSWLQRKAPALARFCCRKHKKSTARASCSWRIWAWLDLWESLHETPLGRPIWVCLRLLLLGSYVKGTIRQNKN